MAADRDFGTASNAVAERVSGDTGRHIRTDLADRARFCPEEHSKLHRDQERVVASRRLASGTVGRYCGRVGGGVIFCQPSPLSASRKDSSACLVSSSR